VLNTFDYSPFGVLLEERNHTAQVYVYAINTNFNTGDVQGWSELGSGSDLNNVSSTLEVSKQGGGPVGAVQSFDAIEGEEYEFSAFVDKGSCNPSSSIEIRIKDDAGNIVASFNLPSGSNSFSTSFTASTSGTYSVEFERVGNNSSCEFYVDDIFVRNKVPYNEYRYGFNGMERDDEVKGSGNNYTTEFRQYDSRLGRWLSIDPLLKSFESPYAAYSNSPVYLADPNGADTTVSTSTAQKTVDKYGKQYFEKKKRNGDVKQKKNKDYVQGFSDMINDFENDKDAEVIFTDNYEDIKDLAPEGLFDDGGVGSVFSDGNGKYYVFFNDKELNKGSHTGYPSGVLEETFHMHDILYTNNGEFVMQGGKSFVAQWEAYDEARAKIWVVSNLSKKQLKISVTIYDENRNPKVSTGYSQYTTGGYIYTAVISMREKGMTSEDIEKEIVSFLVHGITKLPHKTDAAAAEAGGYSPKTPYTLGGHYSDFSDKNLIVE
jgi:RHS repeat-associated protein